MSFRVSSVVLKSSFVGAVYDVGTWEHLSIVTVIALAQEVICLVVPFDFCSNVEQGGIYGKAF